MCQGWETAEGRQVGRNVSNRSPGDSASKGLDSARKEEWAEQAGPELKTLPCALQRGLDATI